MFEHYRQTIEVEIQKAILRLGEKNRLRDACAYALESGGKRLRPLLVLFVADALGHGLDAIPAALSVEFFHTASLIADDLPCMDDDEKRRNRPSLHRMFEESVALLASFTLIAAGYEGIYRNGQRMKTYAPFASGADAAVVTALEIASRCAGINGATGGQFLDLFPPDRKEETIRKIIAQKTVTLFQISFAFGWLFGGGPIALLKRVEEAAGHLGMAFQIADDLQDEKQDASHQMNMSLALGRDFTCDLFHRELSAFESALRELKLWTTNFELAAEYLQNSIPAASQ